MTLRPGFFVDFLSVPHLPSPAHWSPAAASAPPSREASHPTSDFCPVSSAPHPIRADCPPSTGSTTPVMNFASSEARNSAA